MTTIYPLATRRWAEANANFWCSDIGCNETLMWVISNEKETAITCNLHVGDIAGNMAKAMA